MLPSMPVYASGKVVVAVSTSSLNIGDTVTVTATAQNDSGEQVSTTLGFKYDSSKLTFVSCSNSDYSGGDGSVQVVGGKASITLKATASGSASVSVSGSDGLTAGGTTIAISDGTEATTAQSSDNSLSSLKISPGTLSPAFRYSTTSYTASVGTDVNEISVDAKTSNANATIESITGNTDLKEGTNTISIVVKAENGAKATYKIVVTKGETTTEETPEETQTEETNEGDAEAITLNGHDYSLSATIPDDKVPADFTKTTVNCKGQDVEALQFNQGDVMLVYLTTPDAEVKNTLAVYEVQNDSIYPFVKIENGNSYYIILNAPTETELSDMYAASALEIGENGTITAYGNQEPSLSDFYLVYAISNTGNTGWYQYDKAEGTVQRYIQQTEESTVDEEAINAEMKSIQNAYDKLEAQYSKEKDFSRKAIAVLIFLIAVLIVVIVNLILRGRKNEDEWEDDFNEVPKRFRKIEEERAKEEKVKEEKAQEEQTEEELEEERPKRSIFKKKISEESLAEKEVEVIEEENDDFEVIDLDDL